MSSHSSFTKVHRPHQAGWSLLKWNCKVKGMKANMRVDVQHGSRNRSHSATQPLSHSARVAGPATQPLSHSGRVDGPATLTRASEWLSGWVAGCGRVAGAATQPLSHSGRAAGPATQPLSHSEWLSGSPAGSERLSGWVAAPSHSGRMSQWVNS